MKSHTLVFQFFPDDVTHLARQPGEQSRHNVANLHLNAALVKRLSHLKADISRTNDQGPLNGMNSHELLDKAPVFQ